MKETEAMYRFLGRSVLMAALVVVAGISVPAQKKEGTLTCRENSWYNDRLEGNCEIREQTLAMTGAPIAIDGRQNGGIAVKGWDQGQVLVRARVQTGAPTAAEAAELARQIRIEMSSAKIHASGPENRKNYHWDVSYEVFVPRRADLSLETMNGGISISEVNGKIDFSALNGGVVLRRVGGAVRGSTTNGGVVVELGGDRWDGETLDVKTTNGGIVLSIPENYSAKLETGTVNGGIDVDFPVTVQGKINKQLAVNLGSGGATVKATTTNGGVRVKRASSGTEY
jgi:putative adhesin